MTNFLGSDKGMELMYIDSQIATETINYFVKQNKPILPIHDSFIVKELDQDYLLASMPKVIERAVGDWIPFATG